MAQVERLVEELAVSVDYGQHRWSLWVWEVEAHPWAPQVAQVDLILGYRPRLSVCRLCMVESRGTHRKSRSGACSISNLQLGVSQCLLK